MAKDTFNPDYLGLVEETDPSLFDPEEYLRMTRAGGAPVEQDEEPIDVEEMLKALATLEKGQTRVKNQRWYEPEGETPAEKKFKYSDVPETFDDSAPRGEYRKGPGEIPEYDEEGPSVDELLNEFSPLPEEKKSPFKPTEEDLPPEPAAKVSKIEVAKTPIGKKKEVPKAASVAKKTIELSGDVFGEPGKKTQTTKEDEPLKDLRVPWEAFEDTGEVQEEELPWILGSLAAGPAMGLGKAALSGFAKKAAPAAVEESTAMLPKMVDKLVKEVKPISKDTKPILKYGGDVGSKFRQYAKDVGFAPSRATIPKSKASFGADATIDKLLRMVREGKLPAEKARQILSKMG